MIIEKMKSCLWKLQLGFWSYGLIRLLSPSGANVVSRPQTRSIFFSRLHDFIAFMLWFFKKWGPLYENCGCSSGHMAWYISWAQVAQTYFLGPKPKGQEIFWDFMILLDSPNDSWENDVMFVKISGRVLDLWLDTFSWPK